MRNSAGTVFIDRDGVINQDSPNYIKVPDEFHFLPGVFEAFRLLTENGYDAVIITNQSVIGRNMTTPQTLTAIFEKMKAGILSAGGRIQDIFFCPHTPQDLCSCRKPSPGMILEAVKKHGIDLHHSCMIGDSVKDIECGRNAGCRYNALVRTGNGVFAEKTLASSNNQPDYVGCDLLDVVKWLIQSQVLL